MKRVIIIVLSFLCAIVCSCKKEPQDLLIGDWEVSISTEYDATVNGTNMNKTIDGGIWYYSFEENGQGRRVMKDDISSRFEFSYQYDRLFNSIICKFEKPASETIMEIEVLTKDSFVFHSESEATLGSIYTLKGISTFVGKRIK